MLYDLTHTLASGMPHFPGDPQPRVEPWPGEPPWRVSELRLGSHSGTHIDAPRHYLAGGRCIGDYPPERFIRPGLVLDARGHADDQPIGAGLLDGQAEVVIGDRQVGSVEHFSSFKKALQRVGSGVVRWASETDVPDTVSGFRALSRDAALRLFVTTDFSYTVENLIQAGKKGLTVTTVPIAINPVKRPSRLHQGNWNFIKRQAAIITRTYSTYEPLKTFSYLAAPFLLLGVVLLGNAFYVFLARQFIENYPRSNFQSLMGGGVALILGFVIFLFGIIADRIGGVRRVDEELLYRLRSQEVSGEAWRRRVTERLDEIERRIAGRMDEIDQKLAESHVSDRAIDR